MLSDALHHELPRLLGVTYDYLQEKERFDYGEIGQRFVKTLAELVVLTVELDVGWRSTLNEDNFSDNPLRQMLNSGKHFDVIEAVRASFASERRNFRPIFDQEMTAREALPSHLDWITPEISISKKDADEYRRKSLRAA